jgi:hypothetical protein
MSAKRSSVCAQETFYYKIGFVLEDFAHFQANLNVLNTCKAALMLGGFVA